MKLGIAAAGVGAVLLTGCNSDDSADDASSSKPATPEAIATTPEAPSAPATPSGISASGQADSLDGGWLGESDVDKVAMIVQGKKVMLAFQSTDGKKRQACDGLLKEKAIQLQCVEANKDRVKGTVEISSGEKIAIAWTSGKKDLLTKSGNGQVDFSQWGLPSAPAAG
ncbi:hypothetical protein [Streptomyces sp. NBC_00878]|uniref:hypothetical protein n=1 Tax=Streptomyces sp. NBC_00878 TaxID=2975854 RepID=UPI002259CFA0|nr:hypothetical protein [Streptomyces sp. NBC_00878]MCX4911584.1 hypothetical protein [Streptomyces sp. NBC_00878]